jgi:hypothetical protein
VPVKSVDTLLLRANNLKEALADFVYETEGELAVALETYAAQHSSNKERYDIKQQNLLIDTFITEGKVGKKTPLEIFLETEPDLTPEDSQILKKWRHSFTGLFEIIQILPDRFELMNWTTAKHYQVIKDERVTKTEMARWQPGDIILTRIAPISDREWMFFSDSILKGKLSKPKLAVAIGEFKKNYKEYLYSDAPELLKQAWDSVAVYHQEFVDFFGSDRLILSGQELKKKLGELQQIISKKKLAAAGIDDSKSLQEVMKEAGADEEEIAQAAAEMGEDSQMVAKAMKSQEKLSMVTPKIELPPEILKAEEVTAFSHPKWGQSFIASYRRLQKLLESDLKEEQDLENCKSLIRKYLETPEINFYIWQQLKEEYPKSLEKILQLVLERPNFNLNTDLETTLKDFHKNSEPELPDSASVPQHLHNLFEEAVTQVSKSKSKTKKTTKKAKGFQ